jgi:hypothetical protein
MGSLTLAGPRFAGAGARLADFFPVAGYASGRPARGNWLPLPGAAIITCPARTGLFQMQGDGAPNDKYCSKCDEMRIRR